jgi:hypothetical protein
MRMVEHLENVGTLFFRRRGSLPSLIMLPVLFLSLADYRNPLGSRAWDLTWEIIGTGAARGRERDRPRRHVRAQYRAARR